jgi:hypothetical protein
MGRNTGEEIRKKRTEYIEVGSGVLSIEPQSRKGGRTPRPSLNGAACYPAEACAPTPIMGCNNIHSSFKFNPKRGNQMHDKSFEIPSADDMADAVNAMVVLCREIRVEARRCDMIPFLGRDIGGTSVERGGTARGRKGSHDFAI